MGQIATNNWVPNNMMMVDSYCCCYCCCCCCLGGIAQPNLGGSERIVLPPVTALFFASFY